SDARSCKRRAPHADLPFPAMRFCSADRHVALARHLHAQRCNRKRLHTPISVRGAAKSRAMLW
ncbi:hypothetical protein QZM01_28750, partial [Burkholderia multivorans]|nr:hypothetical protein [Burkholderia multivorans]